MHEKEERKKGGGREAEGDRYGRMSMSTRLFDGVCIWPCSNSSAFEFYDMWSAQSSDTKRILLFTCSINNFPSVNAPIFTRFWYTYIMNFIEMNACHPLVPQQKQGCENGRQTDRHIETDQWSMSSLKIEMKSFDNNNSQSGSESTTFTSE